MVEATKWIWRVRLSVMLAVGLALCAVLLLGVLPNTASADTEEGHAGYVGPHRLQEPGAACQVNWSTRNRTLIASAPLVWARSNYTNGQTVAYQAQVLRQDHVGGGYQVVYNGPKFFRTAYPNYRANFPDTQFNFGDTGYAMNYKVRIFMFWYYSNGAQMGYTSHMVDYYYNGNTGATGPYYCRM